MKHISRRLLFLITVMSIAGLVLVYPPLRLANLLLPGFSPSPWLVLALFTMPFAMRALHAQTNHAWSRVLSAIIMTWLGICFIAFTLLLPAELILATGLIMSQTIGQSVGALTIGITAYSIYNAMHLHVHEVNLQAPAALRGTRLVQISDVHIGSRQPGFLRPIVNRINDLQPDYTLITGDLIDMAGIGEADLAPLREIESPVLFCIGNHERYVDLEEICTRLQNLGIEVLRNRSVSKNDIQFIGIDDAERKDQVARQLANIATSPDAYRVLLYHRPDSAAAAAAWGTDLMLTGHTHRGQIFPFNLLVKRVFPKLYRSYEVDGMTLYVSPGTGTWGPVMRLGSKCEITAFNLV